ncbi:hypothetical protein KDH83_17890 [Achromobacter sp. Marseille-Q0513]|uniref:hypothetical protein n=1 Tax=Achromobacter sp. Marseille-Q0513 TaxID=2829161 RepID=UPI001B92A86A|nr:hypothetical protein [Achromobacter sp. Marseille-Q0513]MBR8655179.1 hypothetical protein [Achromobacter sp. Marseille-Q0513]
MLKLSTCGSAANELGSLAQRQGGPLYESDSLVTVLLVVCDCLGGAACRLQCAEISEVEIGSEVH